MSNQLEQEPINICRYSEMEHRFVLHAEEHFGDCFRHSKSCLDLLFDFLATIDVNSSMAFLPFLSQTQMCMLQSTLSCVRRHDIQSQVMLRSALEAAQRCAYGIGHSASFLAQLSESGQFVPSESTMKDVGSWLDGIVPEHSGVIHGAKCMINKDGAHARLGTTRHMFDTVHILPFDPENRDFTRLRLMHLASLCLTIVDMFVILIGIFPVASVKPAAIEQLACLQARQKEAVNSL